MLDCSLGFRRQSAAAEGAASRVATGCWRTRHRTCFLQNPKSVLIAQMNAECLVILTGAGCHSSLQPIRLKMQITAQISLYLQLKLMLRLRLTKL
uniref:Protocadherin 17 n=1 Tax=Macaca fascicularis TaxID=9541 RepID=A0A7N9CTR2_MACFA